MAYPSPFSPEWTAMMAANNPQGNTGLSGFGAGTDEGYGPERPPPQRVNDLVSTGYRPDYWGGRANKARGIDPGSGAMNVSMAKNAFINKQYGNYQNYVDAGKPPITEAQYGGLVKDNIRWLGKRGGASSGRPTTQSPPPPPPAATQNAPPPPAGTTAAPPPTSTGLDAAADMPPPPPAPTATAATASVATPGVQQVDINIKDETGATQGGPDTGQYAPSVMPPALPPTPTYPGGNMTPPAPGMSGAMQGLQMAGMPTAGPGGMMSGVFSTPPAPQQIIQSGPMPQAPMLQSYNPADQLSPEQLQMQMQQAQMAQQAGPQISYDQQMLNLQNSLMGQG